MMLLALLLGCSELPVTGACAPPDTPVSWDHESDLGPTPRELVAMGQERYVDFDIRWSDNRIDVVPRQERVRVSFEADRLRPPIENLTFAWGTETQENCAQLDHLIAPIVGSIQTLDGEVVADNASGSLEFGREGEIALVLSSDTIALDPIRLPVLEDRMGRPFDPESGDFLEWFLVYDPAYSGNPGGTEIRVDLHTGGVQSTWTCKHHTDAGCIATVDAR